MNPHATRSDAVVRRLEGDGVFRGGVAVATLSGERFRHGDCSMVSRVYCCGKVVVALGVLRLCADRAISLDTRCGDVLDGCSAWVGARTVREVLSHDAGLMSPGIVLWRFLPPQVRREATLSVQPEHLHTYGYSEAVGAGLLALIIESIAGVDYRDAVEREVLDHYALGGVFHSPSADSVTPTWYRTTDERGAIPLLSERNLDQIAEWDPATGWYASATGLAELGRAMLLELAAGTAVGQMLASEIGAASPPRFDPVLGHESAFAAGMWTGLDAMGFGTCLGPMAFGHSAQGGTAFVAVSPQHGLAVGGTPNVAIDEDAAGGWRRSPICSAAVWDYGI